MFPRTDADVPAAEPYGDLPPEAFRAAAHALSDWAADFLRDVAEYRVYPDIQPGDVARQLPETAPVAPEPLSAIQADLARIIVPALTQWNHPGNHAYFNSSASAPGILAELATATLNNQGMLWHSGPAATELEQVTLGWLRTALGLPDEWFGIIYDTASVGVLHALAAARERAFPEVRQHGMRALRQLPRVYASAQVHSSVDKALVALGFGLDSLVKVPVDNAFRMDVAALQAAVRADRAAGHAPLCVVSTVGTTSCTAVDPVAKVQALCAAEGLWHHVDAAHGGAMAIVAEFRPLFAGWEAADSIVFNPHKWLFVPMDCSVLYTRHPDVLRRAFSLVAEYLRTPQEAVVNYMDYGIQLGRRFRSLKLWYVLRAFGLQGLAARIREHVRLANAFAEWVDASTDFERMAPVPMSTVCFRARMPHLPPEAQDAYNERLMAALNASGRVFLSHTKLHERLVLRFVVSQLNTQAAHVQAAWELLQLTHRQLATQSPTP